MAQWLSGTVARKTRWNDTHYSLVIAADGPAFVAGQFIRVGIDLGDERVGRPYSLVNPPHERELEIFFNIVPEGPLSRELAALESGDTLWLTDVANGLLTLKEVPTETRDLWLLATGTGVGPFLSSLKTAQPWQRFEKVVLGYSVRTRDELSYMDTIEQILRQHAEQFCFVPFVTRERVADAFNARITETLDSGEFERRAGIAISADDSHVMMCGNSAMISEVSELLQARGLRKHLRREAGHISTEKYH